MRWGHGSLCDRRVVETIDGGGRDRPAVDESEWSGSVGDLLVPVFPGRRSPASFSFRAHHRTRKYVRSRADRRAGGRVATLATVPSAAANPSTHRTFTHSSVERARETPGAPLCPTDGVAPPPSRGRPAERRTGTGHPPSTHTLALTAIAADV